MSADHHPVLDGLEDLPTVPGRRGGAVRYYRNRSASAAELAAEAGEEPALWALEEIATPAPADRRCAEGAWPVYRALHVIGQGRLVLGTSPYTREARLTDPHCLIKQPGRKADKREWVEDSAVRELAAQGLAVLGRLGKYRCYGVWSAARPFELTRAGRALWTRWSYLVDPLLEREDRWAAELETAEFLKKWRASR